MLLSGIAHKIYCESLDLLFHFSAHVVRLIFGTSPTSKFPKRIIRRENCTFADQESSGVDKIERKSVGMVNISLSIFHVLL